MSSAGWNNAPDDRTLSCTELGPYGDAPWDPRVPELCTPRSRRPPTGACGAGNPHADRQPTPSHGMMADKIDDEDPERARRTWGRGGNRPAARGQDRVAGREPGVHVAGSDCWGAAAGCWRAHPTLPPLQDALTAAIRRRVAQRVAWDRGARPLFVGEERTLCALPPRVTAPSQRNAQQGRHADCRG